MKQLKQPLRPMESHRRVEIRREQQQRKSWRVALAFISFFALLSAPLSATAAQTSAAPAETFARGSAPPVTPGYSEPAAGLENRIRELWKNFPGTTGIAIRRIDGDWSLSQRGHQLFPQQSVSKLWVVMTALDAVDTGRISLYDQIRIGTKDLTLFHQPIASRVLNQGSVSISVEDAIEQAITRSDNTINDALLRHAGGPRAVRRFIGRRTLGAIRFGPGERLLQSQTAGMKWNQSMSIGRTFQRERAKLPTAARKAAMKAYLSDPIDGASPMAMANALTRLARGELLSERSTERLLGIMARTRSGPKRLKAGLPAGWKFGHKTGTGQNLQPISVGYNDVGIATAPDGTRYAIVVMLASTSASVPARMRLMQKVSGAVAAMHKE